MGTPDEAGYGEYVKRLKLADGAKLPAHWHPQLEELTVLSGMLLLGFGDTADVSKATPLPAGSFAFIPAKVHHFSVARGQTIVEVHGISPFVMNPVGST